MLTQGEAQYAVDEIEKAIIKALCKSIHNNAENVANGEYVKRLKREMVEMLVRVK